MSESGPEVGQSCRDNCLRLEATLIAKLNLADFQNAVPMLRELSIVNDTGVAVHESFDSVVAYVVEASVQDGKPVLLRVTTGVHCNLAVNPRSVEAQVQGAAVKGLSMCLPGAAITLKAGVVQQSNFGDFAVPRITDMPQFAVHIVPSAEPPTGMGEPGLPRLAPAFANAVARLTGKPLREMPFKLT